ncbi:2-oxoacid:ferredoxin oxidoreductase subunit beta [Rhodothalassium salexigens]|uniref:2-oxoacid:ferredoxin oxidoreductase subunit beta n=1 Tax=Rhodothalassium salexigens TaxID=1086 RepID=UPI001911B43E|nr:2-oxoacid:ferredoxin oxidoreductase subunit beta [Rhodothalassium salexigens]MBK5910260.1 2-oxoacid:ferredoxin oxidoreductase subunit beta [Rhodothalassium salexigens]MBK5921379.1 2-oxoacid:ferredoxin oxidoreductase subunit beta [Rhodothalassium salexigens]
MDQFAPPPPPAPAPELLDRPQPKARPKADPAVPGLAPKDFASDQEVRWCPGCGDYAILKGIQKTLAELGARPESTVFVSGIGCSSRFPYYMNTYGFHTIHGRAPAVATGIKLANPFLDVWVVTGDGDGLSIGGNHLLHALRRNVDLNILLFNNAIYGLTKGQASPTTALGTRTPSTPEGSVDRPINPCAFALGSGARFVARTTDTAQKTLPGLFKRAHAHHGGSFVEIFQNCVVYNDGAFADLTAKAAAPEHQLYAVHGEPLIWGKDRRRGLRLNPNTLKLDIVTVGGDDGVDEAGIMVHNETNPILAQMLATLSGPDAPVVMGVLYCDDTAPPYEEALLRQVHDAEADESGPSADLAALNGFLRQGRTWTVS